MFTDAFIETSHGRIHYLEAGKGQPFLLLHSNGCSAHEYAGILQSLSQHYRVIAWDMPGQGDSDPITEHWSVQRYADAVVAFLEALGIDRAMILGSSIGGSICANLGARFPNRVDRLFIVETPARSAEAWALRWLSVEQNFGLPTQTLEQVSARVKNVNADLLTRWNVDRNKAGASTMMDVMWAIREYEILKDMPLIEASTHLIFGDSGPVGDGIEAFAQNVRGATLQMMIGAGHFPMIDDPEKFSEIVLSRME